jgi:hypothetical protein
MKTFNQFNESLRDKMVGPSKEDAEKSLEKLSENEKIDTIIKYQLDFSLLPRNYDGFCIYHGDLYYMNNNETMELPNNFTVFGNLYCSGTKFILPNTLTVENNFMCNNSQLEKLPDNLFVGGNLYCMNNKLTSLPDNLEVYGIVFCGNNPLPENIKKPEKVRGDIIKK